jgi:hypothetical protein
VTTKGQSDDAARLRLAEADIDRHDHEIQALQQAVAKSQETGDSAHRAIVKLAQIRVTPTAAAAASVTPTDEPAEDAIAWLTLDDAAAAAEILAGLEEWLAAVYCHYPDGELQDCWRRHGSVVEELLALRDAYAAAWSGETGSPTLRMDWHARHRPDAAKRVNETLRSCRIERHVLKQPAEFRPAELRGIDDAAAVAAWWTATHGRSPDPAPTRDALAEAEARKAARPAGQVRALNRHIPNGEVDRCQRASSRSRARCSR